MSEPGRYVRGNSYSKYAILRYPARRWFHRLGGGIQIGHYGFWWGSQVQPPERHGAGGTLIPLPPLPSTPGSPRNKAES